MGAAALMTGVNGLPTEVIKIPALVGAALGINQMPSDYNEEMTEKLSDWFGPTVSNIIMNGPLSMMGPVAPYIPHRAGMSSLLTFGEPSNDDPESLKHWARRFVLWRYWRDMSLREPMACASCSRVTMQRQ